MKILLKAAVVLAIFAPALAHGHGEGDHAHEAPDLNAPAVAAAGANSISTHGNNFDISLTYEAFHEGEPVALDVYLADWQSNLPVTGADIELTITGAKFRGDLAVVETDEPGRYRAQVEVPSEGSYSFLADISHEGRSELMSLTGFATTEHEHGDDEAGEAAFSVSRYQPYLLAGVAVMAGLAGFAFGSFIARRRKGVGVDDSEEVTA